MASFSFALPRSYMAKSKTYLSLVLLFAFLLSSSVLAYELRETSLENQHYDDKNMFKEPNPTSFNDLERERRGGSSMTSFRHFVEHGYKTPTLKETRKSTLAKDIAEVDKFGMKNLKWGWTIGNNGFGEDPKPESFGEAGNNYSSADEDEDGDSSGGYCGSMNRKDASVMGHQNIGRLSKIDQGSFRASQAENIGMKNGGVIHYDGVPKMEDIGEERKN